jgi:DNA polymerase III delta prime subunit
MAAPSGFFIAMAGDNAQSLIEDVDRSLRPFINYIQRAIKTLEKKNVKCRWEPLDRGGWALTPRTRLYAIQPQTKIRVQEPENGWVDLTVHERDAAALEMYGIAERDFSIQWGRGVQQGKLELSKDLVRKTDRGTWQMRFLDNDEPKDLTITWQGYQFDWKRCRSPFEEEKFEFSVQGNEITAKRSGGDELTFILDTLMKGDDVLRINGVRMGFRILQGFDQDGFKCKYPNSVLSRHSEWLIPGTEKPTFPSSNCRDITDRTLRDLCLSDLILDDTLLNQEKWAYDSSTRMLFSLKNEDVPLDGTLAYRHCPGWNFSYEKAQPKDKWIQLLEIERYYDEDTIEKSELDYFFDDNVSIYQTDKRKAHEKYHILKSRPEEYQILLSREKGRGAIFPDSNYLYLKPNVGELKNQLTALRTLESRPFPENLPLVELMQNRESKNWELFKSLSTPKYEWKVLTDSSYDGTDKQRQFVCTALATPDFAILDGPPGTGKTTTIRELILQLILDGQRVLLAASTNAAINNVLERLRDEDKGKAPVHATRLGQKERAMNVEEYVLDEQVKKWMDKHSLNEHEARRLIIESANLVCGTTSGIHRLFNWERRDLDSDPLDDLTRGGAPFDVMIIDECSKTTFQEFLVPARLAKKWIIVGDVRQLSPFTDRGQIATNLENIEGLTPARQTACALLQQLHPYTTNLIVPVNKAVMEILKEEYDARTSGEKPDLSLKKHVTLISSEKLLLERPDILYGYNTLFITDTLLEKYVDRMPKDAILLKEGWMETPHAFTHFSNRKWCRNHSYRDRGKTASEAEDVYTKILRKIDKSWSDEICWRLEREYWLRFLQSNRGKTGNLKQQINHLLPTSRDVSGLVYTIRNIAFPSILESLSGTGMEMKKSLAFTTLTKGFTNDELNCRLVTLTHQHRMHPDISSPPRELFYTVNSGNQRQARSLLDGSRVTGREWSYDVYPSRRVWINCDGQVGKRNSNLEEAKRILHEVKKFGDRAGDRPYEIAILTFYKGQEGLLREKLKELPGQKNRYTHFSYRNCSIRLATVDFFQGQEADIVFLSMVNTFRDGFLDTPNRLNVAITRARHQMVIVGKYSYFKNDSRTRELNKLAEMYMRID